MHNTFFPTLRIALLSVLGLQKESELKDIAPSGMNFSSHSSLMKNSGFVFGDIEMISLNGVYIHKFVSARIRYHNLSQLEVRERTNWEYIVMNVFILDMGIGNDDEGETH